MRFPHIVRWTFWALGVAGALEGSGWCFAKGMTQSGYWLLALGTVGLTWPYILLKSHKAIHDLSQSADIDVRVGR